MPTRTSVRDHREAYAGARLVTGAASMTVRPLLDGPRRDARVLASFPLACYLELKAPAEPCVLALVTADAVRLPNALVVPDTTPLARIRVGMLAQVGTGVVRAGPMLAGAARWWDPAPALPPVTPAHLEASLAHLRALCAASDRRPGLTDADGPAALAAACATGSLADAVERAERVVGLGPGLTPSGDDVLCGLLLSLRLLGSALSPANPRDEKPTTPPEAATRSPHVPAQAGGRRAVVGPPVERRPGHADVAAGGAAAVRLADWIGAAVTCDATTRTTALSATLLHCAAAGQASGEVASVLRAMTMPRAGTALTVAVRRLLATGHTSGADLAWGLAAGGHALLTLTRGTGQRA